MRILVLAPQPFFVHRGTPIAIRTLLETLGADGHALDAIVFAEGEDVEIPNCTISRVPRIPGTTGIGPGFSIRKLVCDLVIGVMAAWRLATRRYDVIHASEETVFIALALGVLTGVPYVYDMDSSLPQQIGDRFRLPRWLARAMVAAERLALRRSAGVLTCCRALEDIARRHWPDVHVRTVEDLSLLAPAPFAPPPPDCVFPEPVVMYVGNLEPYQGVDLLIDGFARASSREPARLVIVGGGDAQIARFRAQAEALGVGDRVTFLGPRPVGDLGRYLGRATIVASPRAKGIATPMKVYSYLESGRPLLATRLSMHTQVLDDRIAMLVDPTPEGVADGLSRLFADAGLRERLAAAAAERVRSEFGSAALSRKLCDFYRKLEIDLRRRAGGTAATDARTTVLHAETLHPAAVQEEALASQRE